MSLPEELLWPWWVAVKNMPLYILFLVFLGFIAFGLLGVFALLHLIAPKPRPVLPSEKTYLTTNPDGSVSAPRQLPCWHDRWLAERRLSERAAAGAQAPDPGAIEPAEVCVSVVFPAYNEEDRLLPTLEEAVAYLDERFGRPASAQQRPSEKLKVPGNKKNASSPAASPSTPRRRLLNPPPAGLSGYEILLVNDGSRDRTVQVALDFCRDRGLHDVLRVVSLERNRGKGGGVTHGFRHVRGEYVLFADADGASRFSDLGRLIEGVEEVVDGSHRGVALGSRAHLVGSEAVVKRSALRNFLMRSFHLVLMILTPPATSRIRDTQCGFKLFSRASLPHIIPYMHTEGWIFDIEMLMLAESAPATPVLGSDGSVIGMSPGIKVAEVPIEWHEVGGSKMSIVTDSIKMAIGLAVLRASWMMGVYRRRLT